MAAWLAGGIAVFYAGWPWFWLSPIGNLRHFLSSATSRQSIHVFYAGRVWPDAVGAEVPRHYTLVMFLVALPLGLLVLGLVGLWARRRLSQAHPAYVLVTGTLLFLLVVFSLPGTPLYDGVRLFLMVFPFWAIPVGIGAKALVDLPAWRAWPARARIATIAVLVGCQGIGLVVYHPYQLSHYSLLVGGLWGAERLGFEVTYWGDTVAESLLAEAARRAPGQGVVYGPNLAPFQAPIVGMSSASLEASRTRLVGWDSGRPEITLGARYGVFYRRKADLAALPPELLQGRVVAEVSRQGVWLARLIEFSDPIGQGRLRHLVHSAYRAGLPCH